MNATPDFEPRDLRPAPSAVDAEQYVIGAVLIAADALPKISDWIAEEDFYASKHRAIWRAVTSLAAAGRPVDAVTVGTELDGEEGIDFSTVIDIASAQNSAANVVAYAEIVKEKSRLRQISDVGQRIAALALRGGKSSDDLAAEAVHALSSMQGIQRTGLRPLKPAIKAFFAELCEQYESGHRIHGRATPWLEMNEVTRGLRPGELIVIGARPAMGKSVVGFGLAAFDALRPGGRTAVFSLEMTDNQFIRRETAALGDVSHDWLRAPQKQDDDEEIWAGVTRGITTLSQANLMIDDTPGLTIQQISARARRAHLQEPLSMVLVDHLHIVGIKGDNPTRELGDVSRGLKKLAKELRVPVVALAQLNRSSTQRADRRPTMADLRASGEIEQDADYIFLLHREDYYDGGNTGLLEVIVGKGRDVAATQINLRTRFDLMRVEDWDGPLPDQPQRRPAKRGFDA